MPPCPSHVPYVRVRARCGTDREISAEVLGQLVFGQGLPLPAGRLHTGQLTAGGGGGMDRRQMGYRQQRFEIF